MTSILKDYDFTAYEESIWSITDPDLAANQLYIFVQNPTINMPSIEPIGSYGGIPVLSNEMRILTTDLCGGDVLMDLGIVITLSRNHDRKIYGEDFFRKLCLVKNPAKSAYIRIPSTNLTTAIFAGLSRIN